MSNSVIDQYRARIRELVGLLQETTAKVSRLEQAHADPIAVIGVACRFPGGGRDPEAFWRALEAGVDGVRRIPAERWPANAIEGDKPATRWAALLESIDEFDAAFFGISPREAIHLDPQQRMVLEVAWEALESAGLPAERLIGSKTGVYLGIIGADYAALAREVDPLDMYSGIGSVHSVAAGRLSYVLGLEGPSVAIDTACSSSLVSVHLACQSLRNQDSDIALAGGVNAILDPLNMAMTASIQAIAPDGRCKTFDARANGFVRGEGCGIVVLKRLADAERDGDPIVAVIRGSVVNQDGRSTGLTAPNVLSQQAMLRRALEVARLETQDIGYVETHGTGTSLGDPIEFEAIREVLGAPRPDGSKCVLGALKTNVGHMEGAAGIGGLIKVVLCLQNKAIPKNLHFKTLNPRISIDNTSLVIPTETIPWKSNGKPRRAGVSSFGISGTNAHVILEEAPPREEKPSAPASSYLLPLSAKTPEALVAMAKSYHEWLSSHDEPLHHVAYTTSLRRSHLECRLTVTGTNKDEIAAALGAFAAGENPPGTVTGKAAQTAPKVVFVFPGQGSQWVGMGRQLSREEPVFRDALIACDEAIRKETGYSVVEELDKPKETSRLSDIDVVQPILFAMEVALAALWRSWGVEPAAVVGHSMGEVAAAYVAGALSIEDAAAIICRRSRLLRKVAGKGAMALIELTMADAEKKLGGYEDRLSVAVSNGPRSTVIAGDPTAINEVLGNLEKDGVFCQRIKTDVASHSPQMDALLPAVLSALSQVKPKTLNIPMRSTVTGEALRADEFTAQYWANNLRQPVRFSQAIDASIQDGHAIFIELSPHPVLLPFIDEKLQAKKMSSVVVASLRFGRDERQTMLSSLGTLFTLGVPISWKTFFPERGRVVELPTYPWQKERYWIEKPSSPNPRPDRIHDADAPPGRSFTVGLDADTRYWEMTLLGAQHGVKFGPADDTARILPLACVIEMSTTAARTFFNVAEGTRLHIADLELREPLSFSDNQPTPLQLSMTREPNENASLGLFDRAPAEASATLGDWQKLMSGQVSLASANETTRDTRHPSIEELRARCNALPPTNASEVHCGASSCTVVDMRRGPGEALAQLRTAEASTDALSEYQRRTALLQAAFEVLAAVLSPSGRLTPFRLGEAFFDKPLEGDAWVWVRAGANGLSGHVSLLNSNGDAIAEFTNVHYRPVENREQERALDELFIETTWEKEAVSTSPADVPGTWLIFADDSGHGEFVQKTLQARGHHVLRVSKGPARAGAAENEYWANPMDFDSLNAVFDAVANQTNWKGIVFAWGLDANTMDASAKALSDTITDACSSVAYLLRALNRARLRPMPRVWMVTRGAQTIAHEVTTSALIQAPLWGITRTARVEFPTIPMTLVDLAPSTNQGAPAKLADLDDFVQELLAGTSEDEIALRPDGRYVARLEYRWDRMSRVRSTPGSTVTIREDGAYLINNGHGVLGHAALQWLASQGARHFIVLGRQGTQNQEDVAAMDLLRSGGAEIRVEAVTAADSARVQEMVHDLDVRGVSLRGVIHCANMEPSPILQEYEATSFHTAMDEDIRGAWNLCTSTNDRALDFHLLFSGLAGMIDSVGFGKSAAIGAFLTALAESRNCRRLTTSCIAWGPGPNANSSTVESDPPEAPKQRGFGNLTREEIHAALSRVLSGEVPFVGVGRFEYRQWIDFHPQRATSPRISRLARRPPWKGKQKPADASLLGALAEARGEKRLGIVEGFLAEQVALVLRMKKNKIHRRVILNELGIDSLMALEIRNRLESGLGIMLPSTLLWAYPDIASIAEHVLAKIEAEWSSKDALNSDDTKEDAALPPVTDSDELTDEEAEALLAARIASIEEHLQ